MTKYLALLLLIPSLSWGIDKDTCKKLNMSLYIKSDKWEEAYNLKLPDDIYQLKEDNELRNKLASELANLIIIYNHYCKK